MRLEVPFIKSRGFECGQACVAMIIKYFYPEFEPNFDEFNKIIHHKNDTYSFPPQLAILLDHFNVKTKVYSSDDIKRSDEDPDQFKRWYGKDFEHEMENINLESFDWMVNKIRENDLFKLKSTRFDDLLNQFKKGNLVTIPIDWNTLNNKKGPYAGHFVIISGIEDKYVLINDPDIGPYQKHGLNQLQKAWEHPAIADDYIIAFGKK